MENEKRLKLIKTACSYCGVGCGFVVDEKIRGDKTHPNNKGLLCKKGSLSDRVNNNRLLKPLFRENKNEEFREISYQEAIKIVAGKLKATKPQKIGFYLSGQMLNEDYYIANKLAKGYLKTSNVDTNSRTCMASAVVAMKRVWGSDYVPLTMQDAIDSDLVIFAGSNAAESHIVFFNRIKRAKKRGLKIIVIDPRFTKTAKEADLYVPISPGGDTYFFLAVAKRFLELGVVDESVVREVNVEDGYFERLKEVNIDKNLEKAGVKRRIFEEFVKEFIENKNVVGCWTMGLNQSSEGVEKNIAFINLFILSGKIFKPKNGPLSLTGQPNAMGGREVGGLATTLAVHLDYSPENVKKVEEFWGVSGMPTSPGLTADEMIKKENLEFLLVMHTDPVYHLPNRHLTEKKISQIDFVVEVNAYKNSETSKFANLIIPAAPFGEKRGTQTNLDRLISKIIPFREKKAKQDYEILCDIAKELGFSGFDFSSDDEVFREYQEMTKLSDMNIYEAKEFPFRWGENLSDLKRINLLWVEPKNRTPLPNETYSFILVTMRVANHWHSMSKTSQVIKDEVDFVEMNEEDMRELGVSSGEIVRVESEYGSVEVRVNKARIKRKVVAIPMHFRKINYLVHNILDPLSKEPDYNTTRVRVEKV
ncbi:molybdopterin oxidoreductase family protein [Caminibacter pacificus]